MINNIGQKYYSQIQSANYTRLTQTAAANLTTSQVSSTQATNSTDDVSLSSEALNKLAIESRFTLNKNTSDIGHGGLKVVKTEGISGGNSDRTTRLESKLMAGGLDFYKDAAKNPEKMMKESYADYELFLNKADEIIAELNKLNKSGSLDFEVSGRGMVKILNAGEKMAQQHADLGVQIDTDVKEIKNWLTDNKNRVEELSELSSRYTISKSMFDYEAATGINRQNLVDNSLKPMATEGHYKSSDSELNEYAMRILSYADQAFGTNPISYSDADQQGAYGYSRFSTSAPAAKLPNMT